MDFLDPRKRRSHKIRLMLGYGLVAIAIGLATTILVYGAYGYGIDTKTGNIVQNGLLFVDSRPGNSGIYLNNKYQDRDTAARLVLPAGNYELTLKKEGYRDWSRSFTLEELTVSRFVYPLLFPEKPLVSSLKAYTAMPELVTSSPDRRWLLAQVPSSASLVFDEFDTADLDKPARVLTLPRTLLTGGPVGKFTEIEWSSDNNYLLLKHDFTDGYEFILVNRREPAQSLNLNRHFQTAPTQVRLYDKKVSRVYIYDQPAQTLRRGEINSRQLEPILLNQVLSFKPYGANLVSYVTTLQAEAGTASVNIWDDGRSYRLTPVTAAPAYLIDAAQFQGQWYYVAGSAAADRITIFKNPLSDLKSQTLEAPAPIATLRIAGATEVNFSTNTRFVGLQAGQKFAVYDFENKERYQYTYPTALAAPMRWMDGHRFIGLSEGNLVVMDYDSTNRQVLLPSSLALGGFFDKDYNRLFTLAKSGAGVSLQSADLRAGSDLPRN